MLDPSLASQRRMAWLVALALLAAACTPDDEDTVGAETPDTDPSTTTTTTLVLPEEPEDRGSFSGRLVVLDGAGNIVVMDPDGSNRKEITTDAGRDVMYTQPIWSPDATTLSWGEVRPDVFSVGIGGVDHPTEATSIEVDDFPFYMYWAPDGSHIGLLRNGPSGIDFELVDLAESTSSVVGAGQPYYFSWSPSGDRVVAHVGAERFEIIDHAGDRTALGSTDAGYLAPQWTPAGIFHIAGSELVLEDEEPGERVSLAEVTGPTTFVANPEGTHVALQLVDTAGVRPVVFGEAASVPTNAVAVVDVESLAVEVVTRQPPIGFFWSPNGEALLVLTINESRDGVVPMVWRVDGPDEDYIPFVPVPSRLQDLFPFFPQYAQSMSFWAADSSAFAFAGLVDGESGVWVQDLDQDRPQRVSSGTWVAWSSG